MSHACSQDDTMTLPPELVQVLASEENRVRHSAWRPPFGLPVIWQPKPDKRKIDRRLFELMATAGTTGAGVILSGVQVAAQVPNWLKTGSEPLVVVERRPEEYKWILAVARRLNPVLERSGFPAIEIRLGDIHDELSKGRFSYPIAFAHLDLCIPLVPILRINLARWPTMTGSHPISISC
jgi:hypothetical protein